MHRCETALDQIRQNRAQIPVGVEEHQDPGIDRLEPNDELLEQRAQHPAEHAGADHQLLLVGEIPENHGAARAGPHPGLRPPELHSRDALQKLAGVIGAGQAIDEEIVVPAHEVGDLEGIVAGGKRAQPLPVVGPDFRGNRVRGRYILRLRPVEAVEILGVVERTVDAMSLRRVGMA